MLHMVALLALFASAQGRAVNISNTWVLPEEGFPVFYRYFRDRISWYEADAVCQFHHANLVTVDTTAQYDAVRAYLKELDISNAVWVGLIRSNPDGDFTWTDYRGLSGDGYWSSAPDSRDAPLCAAADPASDYRWKARACGGPAVASFICELPVPQWALGSEGCMIRALPALTILYLPESAAVQLTADCGLAGVKRIQCTGNMKRQGLLKDLSCTEEEEVTTIASATSGAPWSVTTDVVFTDQDTTTESITENNGTIGYEDDMNHSSTILPTSRNLNFTTDYYIPMKNVDTNKFNRKANVFDNNIDLALFNNNIQNNIIPKIASTINYLAENKIDKLGDEKHLQHRMLDEEIARLGSLNNIFTQPTDHFIPPLVMAKAKISNDMTVLSLQEKHAQQMAEHHLVKEKYPYKQSDGKSESYIITSTTEEPKDTFMQSIKSTESTKNDKNKITLPKKYNEKIFDYKSKIQSLELENKGFDKTIKSTATPVESLNKYTITTLPLTGRLDDMNDPPLNLTVLLKDAPEIPKTKQTKQFYYYSGDISRLEVIKNETQSNETEIKLYDVEATEEVKQEHLITSVKKQMQDVTLNTEIGNTSIIPVKFEMPSKAPIRQDNISVSPLTVENNTTVNDTTLSEIVTESTLKLSQIIPKGNVSENLTSLKVASITRNVNERELTTMKPIVSTTTALSLAEAHLQNSDKEKLSLKDNVSVGEANRTTTHTTQIETTDILNADIHEDFVSIYNSTGISDDYDNSPLLSGANEPLRRPNRSRRPQQQPNRNKFNPFRILG